MVAASPLICIRQKRCRPNLVEGEAKRRPIKVVGEAACAAAFHAIRRPVKVVGEAAD